MLCPRDWAAAERKRQKNPQAPAVLFAACCDLKEKENVGPKQKFQLYQLVWTELTASRRKGAVPTHTEPGNTPLENVLWDSWGKNNPCLSPGTSSLSSLPVCAHPLCSPGEAHLIPAAGRNAAALLSWEQDKPTQAELTHSAEIKAVFLGCSVNKLWSKFILQIFHVLHQSV